MELGQLTNHFETETIPIVESDLPFRQELFCQYYARPSDSYGNGTHSYALAYDFNLDDASNDDAEWDEAHKHILIQSTRRRMENTCAVNASKLLRSTKILNRVRQLKIEYFNDDDIIDSRMMDIILHGKDTDSVAAIKHRNELKQRVIKKVDLTTGGKPFPILGGASVSNDNSPSADT